MRAASLIPLALLGLAACSRGDPAAKHRLFAREGEGARPAAFDREHPQAALGLDADEVARRLGSFEWVGAVEWSVERATGGPLRVTEGHRVRQAATGEFEVRADVDPGLGLPAVQGKQVVYVGGMTYARALPAPFRERPTDHGRDARRYREDSFELVGGLAALVGPGLKLRPDGGETVLGREALRYRFFLEAADRPAPPPPPGFQAGDPDTVLRTGFLRGAVPSSAEGELALDARSGAPLRARLSARFATPAAAGGSPGPGVTVAASGQVKAMGGEVKPVAPPPGALPDERKPAGPSAALEAAGLKKHGQEGSTAEPSDESD